MGRFYAAPQALQVPRGAAPAAPSPVIPGGVVRAPPPMPFGPFMIRPELVGAPVFKPIIPPYADRQTIASLAPPSSAVNASNQPPSGMPSFLTGTQGSSVQPIFRSDRQQKIARANNAIVAAAQAAQQAETAHQAAAVAAQQASAAQVHAAANPHPINQQAATEATAWANGLANQARVLAITAAQQNARATTDVNQAMTNSGDPQSVYDGGVPGTASSLDLTPDPDAPVPYVDPATGALVVPPTPPAGHPYLVTAGAAGVGFLLGGPIGALIGAVAGGGYAYMKASSDQAAAADAASAAAIQSANTQVQPSGGAAAMASLRGYRW